MTATTRAHPIADRGALAVLGLTLLFVAPMQAWVAQARGTAPLHTGVELRMLAGAALLALVLPLVQIVLEIRAVGGPAIRGNRVGFPADTGAGGRVGRAHRNLIESLAPFAAAVLAAHALGVSTATTVAASVLYLVARLVHAASYAFGVTVLRSAAFYAGVVATFVILAQLPWLR